MYILNESTYKYICTYKYVTYISFICVCMCKYTHILTRTSVYKFRTQNFRVYFFVLNLNFRELRLRSREDDIYLLKRHS